MKKPNGYWNLQTCKLEIVKCKKEKCCISIIEFRCNHGGGCYHWLQQNRHVNLLDHLRVIRHKKYWNLKKCKLEIQKCKKQKYCKNIRQFQKNHSSCYHWLMIHKQTHLLGYLRQRNKSTISVLEYISRRSLKKIVEKLNNGC